MGVKMTIRWHGRAERIEETEFEARVRAGEVPPDALIVSPSLTQGRAVRAEELEVYHLWIPDAETARAPSPPSVLSAIYKRRRLSVTEALLLANLVTSGVLLVLWRQGYSYLMRDWARDLRLGVTGWYDVRHLLPPTFVHGDPGHLFGNLFYLFAFGAVVEYCLGAWRTVAVYILSAYAGSVLSYFFLDSPGLSVGASGAVFGLIGATVFYLLRHRRDFHAALGWRVRRVFIPLVLAVTVHSVATGNLWAHAGGLGAGLLLGALLDRPLSAARDAETGDSAVSAGRTR